MQQADVLVIGAGAAGLMAAMQLSRKGKNVLVLEARDRTGGRIHSITDSDFPQGVELGAEFVHGKLPVTLKLLKEAGIKHPKATGDMWRYANGKFSKADEFLIHYEVIIKKLNALKKDITLDKFLRKHLSAPKYHETCTMLRNFAAGYDTADPSRFSAFAMRMELQSEDDEHQYRVAGGYKMMLAYLESEIMKAGSSIRLSTVIKQIEWQPGNVTAVADDGQTFSAAKIIIAIPLAVLQAGESEMGAISFLPAIPERMKAIQQMGMGAIIKILLQFDEVFWERQALKRGADKDIKKMSYLFSNEAIPTWWIQRTLTIPLLTGWLGGPPAMALKDATDDYLLDMALQSLSNIYAVTVADLSEKLNGHKIMNWAADPFARGSYSYATVATSKARKLLNEPKANTIYFAGEALYNGPEMGTVEAALASGVNVAGSI